MHVYCIHLHTAFPIKTFWEKGSGHSTLERISIPFPAWNSKIVSGTTYFSSTADGRNSAGQTSSHKGLYWKQLKNRLYLVIMHLKQEMVIPALVLLYESNVEHTKRRSIANPILLSHIGCHPCCSNKKTLHGSSWKQGFGDDLYLSEFVEFVQVLQMTLSGSPALISHNIKRHKLPNY